MKSSEYSVLSLCVDLCKNSLNFVLVKHFLFFLINLSNLPQIPCSLLTIEVNICTVQQDETNKNAPSCFCTIYFKPR